MKRLLVLQVTVFVVTSLCWAVPITLFIDTDMFIKRAQDIIIAKCLPFPEGGLKYRNGHPVEVEVLMVLKGQKKVGKLKIATIYPMKPDTIYMLTSLGGSAYGTDFLALPELSVIPIPSTFDLDTLKGKSTKEQLQRVFSRDLFEVERKLEPLLEKKSLLEKALRDRKDNLYESAGNVHITAVYDVTTKEKDGIIYLDFKTAKLEWSHSTPGKSGFFYFTKMGTNTPHWEFSPSSSKNAREFDGKPLRARFYGMYSPGGKKALDQRGYNSICVTVGQVVLARTIHDPSIIYIIKIESQEKETESLKVKYAVLRE